MVVFASSKDIQKAHDFAASFDDPRRTMGIEDAVDRFVSGNALAAACFGGQIKMLQNKTVAKLSVPISPDQYDWDAWRLALEYSLLDFRSCGTGPISSWVPVSERLRSAYELYFLGQNNHAKALLESIREPIVPVTNRLFRGTANELFAVGQFFLDLTGSAPKHQAFDLTMQPSADQILDVALRNRGFYADASKEGGALLAGPIGNLVPLEAIYLNSKKSVSDQDEVLAGLYHAMAATEYPSDDQFIDLDIKLATAGY
jgi:hypothetical protein